ncbi:patatin family protein [Erysipelothrix urinaevulpis]|uniref:patatin-like phospholipase family protein n=1 Tax=Erysipelothrix urinaevulpis TaxID=2683717 RepID=UPI001357C6E8|nr:patatin family protein [Erysipelothrix urinaevulpis]
MEKISLVLEGGGMRGAYTAGVLSWFIEHGVEFDYIVGISSGALYGSMYAMKKQDALKKSSIDLATDKRNVGIRPLISEHSLVGYDFLFNIVQEETDYPIHKIDEIKSEMEIGVYDIEGEETIWVNQNDIAKHPDYVKAACTLPVVGHSVVIEGKKYMDGGITTMIPVNKSIEKGCTKHVIVTTKSKDYVRKDQGFLQKHLLRFLYRKSPRLVEDFESRRDVYYQERAQIDQLVDDGQAIYLYPTKEYGVKRFGGDREKFEALFDLAYQDCDARKEELLSFMKK